MTDPGTLPKSNFTTHNIDTTMDTPTTEVMCPNCHVAMVDGVCPKCGMKAEDMHAAPAAEMPAEEAAM